jgi:hypothetical protein
MTVYVDDFRVPANVGRIYSRWSHLTADTKDELHAFASQLGLQRRWFQTCKRSQACKPAERCRHWHYDVTDPKRDEAIRLGAKPIGIREMGALTRARGDAMKAAELAATDPLIHPPHVLNPAAVGDPAQTPVVHLDPGSLTAADCERIFHAALTAGDARGAEAALLLLAVRDPGRAQALLDVTRFTLAAARDEATR